MLAGWVVFGVESPTLYRGGFLAYALSSAAVVIAATASRTNLIGRFLSLRPLVWIGRMSYGAYVYHWPIFLLLNAERTGLTTLPLLLLRTGLTFFIAWLSYRTVEQPIRYSSDRFPLRALLAGAAAGGALIAVLAAVQHPGMKTNLETKFGFRRSRSRMSNEPFSPARKTADRFSFFGDSVALTLLPMSVDWLEDRGMTWVPSGGIKMGCALIDDAAFLARSGWGKVRPECRQWVEEWDRLLKQYPTDIAIIYAGSWDLLDRKLPNQKRVRAFGDSTYDELFRAKVEEVVSVMRSHGVHILWLTYPMTRFQPGRSKEFDVERTADPKRYQRHNEILRQVAEEFNDSVTIIEFGSFLNSHPAGPYDKAIRPDGVHFSIAGANQMGREFLNQAILDEAKKIAARNATISH